MLSKTLYSHSASLHQGVEMGTSKLPGKAYENAGELRTWDGLASHPGAMSILLVASNRDKIRQQWATRLVRLSNHFSHVKITFRLHVRNFLDSPSQYRPPFKGLKQKQLINKING